MRHDDDDGQVDGDDQPFASPFARSSPFAQSMTAQPWLKSPMPPWHLWGNTQRLDLELPVGVFNPLVQQGQLTRISYSRPETWHWLFTARLIHADDAEPLEQLQLTIVWELTVGIGRSVQINGGFDNYNISWGTPLTPTDAAPNGRLIWTTETFQAPPGRNQFIAPAVEPLNRIDSIVAQDIQLNVRAALLSPVFPRTVAKSATVEIGAQWSPRTHVRPDWYLDGPTELRFAGSETGGK